jgi:hypothetical protein
MARCFLSYSEAYRPVMEVIRRLLEVLEFQVDVFDGPDLDRPPITVAQQRIAAADCVILLLGPLTNDVNKQDAEPAHWPAEEGVWAVSRDKPKPVALILHPGTRVPESLRILQTPARFNFWDSADVLKNIHHVVKHLLDLKRRVDLPPGDQPFLYTKAIIRHKIHRDGTQLVDVYHEAVARQEWSRFHHELDTGMDKRQGARVQLVSPDSFDIEATLNPGRHDVTLQFERITDQAIPYFVNVNPPLLPGERLGYRREFTIKNSFPLTRGELMEMAAEEGFPDLYKVDGRLYYGEVWDVLHDMESVSLSIHFPRKFPVRSKRAFAFSINSKTVNALETERCNSSDCLTLEEPPDGDRVLSLVVRRPIINHQYVILYEPSA